MKAKDVKVGELIEIELCSPKKGTFPIGRYSGIICKVYIPKDLGHLSVGTTCLAKVDIVNDTFLNVTIEKVVRTPETNDAIISEKLKILSTKHNKKKNEDK